MKPVDPRLLRYARATRVFLAAVVALGLAGAGLVVAQAVLLAGIVVGAFQRGLDTGALNTQLLLLVAVSAGRGIVSWLTELAAHRASAAAKSELRMRLLRHATRLGPGWLGSQRSGELSALATRGVDALDDYFARYLPQLGLAVVVPAAVLGRIVLDDWVSAAVVVATLPLIPVFMVLIGWATQSMMDRQWRQLARLSGHFLDVVAGLPTLKIFGRARAQADSIRAVTADYRRATLRTLRVAFLSSFALELLSTLSVALVAVGIGMRLVHGDLDLTTGLVVLILAPEAYLPLRQVGAQYHAAAEGVAAAEEVFAVLETEPAGVGTVAEGSSGAGGSAGAGGSSRADGSGASGASRVDGAPAAESGAPGAGGSVTRAEDSGAVPDGRGSAPRGRGAAVDGSGGAPQGRGAAVDGSGQPELTARAEAPDARRAALRIDRLVVRHPGRPEPSLPETTLEVAPGETVAVTGPSGAGKSTLLAAVLGFAQPAAGRVLLDGTDLREVAPDSWRRQIAWVPQRPYLFAGTIAENVRLARPEADHTAVRAALRDAGALGFVSELPDGPEAPIGEGGAGLSAGQRQRIALARAFLADRPVLLLDEPTANLDGATESAVVDAVRRLAAGRTVLMTVHRPALLAVADRVAALPRPSDRAPAADPAAAAHALACTAGLGAAGTARAHAAAPADATHAIPGLDGPQALEGPEGLGGPTGRWAAESGGGDSEHSGSAAAGSAAAGSGDGDSGGGDAEDSLSASSGSTSGVRASAVSPGDGSMSAVATGDSSTGDSSTGDGSADDSPPGDSLTGDNPTGDGCTGDSSTRDGSTSSGSISGAPRPRGPEDRPSAGGSPAAAAGDPLRRVRHMAKARRGRFALALLLGSLALGSAVGLMAVSGYLISRASEQPPVLYLMVAVTATRAFGIGRAVFRYAERLVAHDAVFRMLADLRVAVFRRLERLAPAGLRDTRRGDLLSRLVADVDSLQDYFLRWLLPVGAALLVSTGAVGFTAWLLPEAGAVLAAGLLAAGVGVPLLSGAISRRAERRLAPARGALSVRVLDLLTGTAELTVAGALPSRTEDVRRADGLLTSLAARSATAAGAGAGLASLICGLTVAASAWTGVRAVHDGRLAGVALAVVVLTPLAAFEAVSGLPLAVRYRQRAHRAAGRVQEVLTAPEPVREPEQPAEPPAVPFPLTVRNLTARHPGQRAPALDGIDLDLGPGRRIAVVGPSGSGKTTLAQVLLRFLDAESGTYALAGTDAAALDGDAVRRLVGLCAQDAHLFDSSLRENLRLARPGAEEPELRAALRRARLLDWADGLPDGLDTLVGEHGARLSGGQRQRLALARALLADFPVLVLDEPAEHLDLATADAVTADLLAATAGRATVLITHRLAGLDAVDEIVVLEAGRAAQRGTYAELAAAEGPFRRMLDREREADTRRVPPHPGVRSRADRSPVPASRS